MLKLTGDEEQLLVPMGGEPSSSSNNPNDAEGSQTLDEPSPPSFSTYDADYFIDGSGNIITHDPHLNTDGEALYRFLLAHSYSPPSLHLKVKATHQESRTRLVRSTGSNGRSETRTESYQETVTDFDFIIDLSDVILPVAGEPIHWTYKDHEPAYRGKMVREVENHEGKRTATRVERKTFARWTKLREGKGYPPWVSDFSGVTIDAENYLSSRALGSSKSLRQWADEYCASGKYLKEFTYSKELYGWDFDHVLEQVNSIVKFTVGPFFQGNIQIDLEHRANKIRIRPDNRLSRTLSNVWLKILLWILLVYPFIWLFKRFHSKGGGRWEVCGGAYPITRYKPISDQERASSGKHQDQPPPEYDEAVGSSSGVIINPGRYVVEGVKEHQWLVRWKPAIVRAVRSGYESTIPLAG